MAAPSWSRYEALIGGVSARGFPARGSSREGGPGGRRSSEEGRAHGRTDARGGAAKVGLWGGGTRLGGRAAWRGVAWGRVGECGRGRQRVQGRDGGLQ